MRYWSWGIAKEGANMNSIRGFLGILALGALIVVTISAPVLAASTFIVDGDGLAGV